LRRAAEEGRPDPRAEELGTAYADGCEAPPRAKRALRNF
jgi:hypothetical protein